MRVNWLQITYCTFTKTKNSEWLTCGLLNTKQESLMQLLKFKHFKIPETNSFKSQKHPERTKHSNNNYMQINETRQ
jgi:hypothetical protein